MPEHQFVAGRLAYPITHEVKPIVETISNFRTRRCDFPMRYIHEVSDPEL
jgi:hypothetical protein